MARTNYGSGLSGPAPVGGDPRRYAQYLASMGMDRDDIYAQLVTRFPVDSAPNVVYSAQWFGRLATYAFRYGDTLRDAYTYPDNTMIGGASGIPADANHGSGWRYGINVGIELPGGQRTGRYIEITSSGPLSVGDIRAMAMATVTAVYQGGRTGSSWSARRPATVTGDFTILFVDRP